jgi:hypothetical protein
LQKCERKWKKTERQYKSHACHPSKDEQNQVAHENHAGKYPRKSEGNDGINDDHEPSQDRRKF